jgi:transcriptional regulator with XRE-family HTH domain
MSRNSRQSLLIDRFKAWRTAQGLTQAKAAQVLADAGLPIAVRTLQQWEIGRRSPQSVTAAALEKFLAEQEKQTETQTRTSIAPVVQRLRRWREQNNLSTTQAAELLTESGLPVKVNTIHRWESGLRHPSALAAKAITSFLDQVHATTAQQRLYWRLKELQKELAAAHRSVAEKRTRNVVQIVDELVQVVEDLLDIAPTSPKNKRHG